MARTPAVLGVHNLVNNEEISRFYRLGGRCSCGGVNYLYARECSSGTDFSNRQERPCLQNKSRKP